MGLYVPLLGLTPLPQFSTKVGCCVYEAKALPFSYSLAEVDWAPLGEYSAGKGAAYANP